MDAFTGILDRQLLGAPTAANIGNPQLLSAAVILSQNTKDQIAWSKKATSMGGFNHFMTSFFVGEQASADADQMCELAYDPKFITDGVMQPIVHRFGSVKVIDDPSQFTHGTYDILILIDVSFVDTHSDGVYGIGRKYETGTNINAYFIDRKYTLAGAIEVAKKRRSHATDYMKDVTSLRGETLAQYNSSVRRLLGPDPTLAATQPAAPPSAADRLKALEDLVRQGLITPEEAAQKKAEILKSL